MKKQRSKKSKAERKRDTHTITMDLVMLKTCASFVSNFTREGKNKPKITAKDTPVNNPVWRNMNHNALMISGKKAKTITLNYSRGKSFVNCVRKKKNKLPSELNRLSLSPCHIDLLRGNLQLEPMMEMSFVINVPMF